ATGSKPTSLPRRPEVDRGCLIGAPSARKWFPAWRWIPLHPERPEHWMRTWAAWAGLDLKYGDVLLGCLRETARRYRADPTYEFTG
uniref:hypothetical protein n=1 Tax=Amycolatopsis orientalis TaxID=31958 RepID=UPI001F2D3A06